MEATAQLTPSCPYAASYVTGWVNVSPPVPIATGGAPTRQDEHAGLKIPSIRETKAMA
jgi:hypothetical protein